MLLAELKREALTETWEEVEKLVYGVIHKFQARWGGDWDDLLSEAHDAFLQAAETYKPGKGHFTTWVATKVRWRLMEYRRTDFRRSGRTVSMSAGEGDWAENIPEKPTQASLFENRLNDLSPPAKIVAKVLLDKSGKINNPRTTAETRMKNLLKWFTTFEEGGFDLRKALEEIKGIL